MLPTIVSLRTLPGVDSPKAEMQSGATLSEVRLVVSSRRTVVAQKSRKKSHKSVTKIWSKVERMFTFFVDFTSKILK